ncbi:unnamed protein product [Chrysoparadoxa australica]
MPTLPSTAGHASKPPRFLCHLVDMLKREDPTILHWNNGKLFLLDPNRLVDEVLGRYFRHTKYTSFQRQLHYFGFRKIEGKGRLVSSVYAHGCLRGEQNISAILTIQRKASASAGGSANASPATKAPAKLKSAHGAKPPRKLRQMAKSKGSQAKFAARSSFSDYSDSEESETSYNQQMEDEEEEEERERRANEERQRRARQQQKAARRQRDEALEQLQLQPAPLADGSGMVDMLFAQAEVHPPAATAPHDGFGYDVLTDLDLMGSSSLWDGCCSFSSTAQTSVHTLMGQIGASPRMLTSQAPLLL